MAIDSLQEDLVLEASVAGKPILVEVSGESLQQIHAAPAFGPKDAPLKASSELANEFVRSGQQEMATWIQAHAAILAAAEGDRVTSEECLDSINSPGDLPTDNVRRSLLLFDAARARTSLGDLPIAFELLERARRLAELADHPTLRVFLSKHAASVAASRDDLATAQDLLSQSLEIRPRKPLAPWTRIESLQTLGRIALDRDELRTAERRFSDARSLRNEHHLPDSSPVLTDWAELSIAKGEHSAATAQLKRLYQHGTRGTPHTARVLHLLGVAAHLGGRHTEAEDLYLKSLEVKIATGSEPLEIARSLKSLAITAYDTDRPEEATRLYERSLDLLKATDFRGMLWAEIWLGFGNLAWGRGNYTEAETWYLRVLEIQEGIAPEGLRAATTIGNLGVLYMVRGDLRKAERQHLKALEIRTRVAPNHPSRSHSLSMLGVIADRQARFQDAERLHWEALKSRRQHSPGSLDEAESLTNLAVLAGNMGRLQEAIDLQLQAVAIKRLRASSGERLARSLTGLAEFRKRQGTLRAAQALYLEALEIVRSSKPGSGYEARILSHLAEISLKTGDNSNAIAFFEASLEALEKHRRFVGGGALTRSNYGAASQDIYLRYRRLLASLGQDGRALEVLEMSRARVLLDLLHVDEPKTEVHDSQLRAALDKSLIDFDRVYDQMLDSSSESREQSPESLLDQLDDIREHRRILLLSARANSPTPPSARALSHQELQKALPSSTLLLAFDIGPNSSALFVAQHKGSPTIFRLDLKKEDLNKKIQLFRDLVTDPKTSPFLQARRERAAKQLYELLFAPAHPLLQQAEKLVIVPDQQMYQLPFAALLTPSPTGWRYLGEWRPYSIAASGSVLVQILKRERQLRRKAPVLMAFGDPDYGSTDVMTPEWKKSRSRGLKLGSLPAARDEVSGISKLFRGETKVFIGAAASESQAREVAESATHLHFACHGLLDSHNPLDSALALASTPREPDPGKSGLLHAWEVLEQFRLEADLVVLSACDSARGAEIEGEGSLGLQTAFLKAGASSVVSTLWKVDDTPTSQFMVRLYEHLASGHSKAEALRLVRSEFIHGAVESKRRSLDLSDPAHWAAFQLYGAGE